MRPTPGQLAPTTAAAVERLKRGQPGETVTELEMAGVIDQTCGPGSAGYCVVYRATRHVLREYHVAWVRDRTIPGWRCLDGAERVGAVRESGTKRVRRLARKHIQLLAVPSGGLSPEDQRDQQILQVTHGMIYMATTGKFRKQITGQVAEWEKLRKPEPPALIALMRSNGNKAT